MPRYHIHFKASYSNAPSSEHTRCIDAALPLEYESDIELMQQWAAKEVGAERTIITNWSPLKGEIRPGSNREDVHVSEPKPKKSIDTAKLDGVDYLRTAIAGALLALIEKQRWDAEQAAQSLGASAQNTQSLISKNVGGMPLEVLVDMAMFAGLEMQLSITMPKS